VTGAGVGVWVAGAVAWTVAVGTGATDDAVAVVAVLRWALWRFTARLWLGSLLPDVVVVGTGVDCECVLTLEAPPPPQPASASAAAMVVTGAHFIDRLLWSLRPFGAPG
jgi:hypothetical protein